MHDKLYDDQALWSGNPGAVGLFKQFARTLGLDGPVFDACLDGGAFAAEVLADKQEGAVAGVPGTPTFFLYSSRNSATIYGAYPFSTFQQVIDILLSDAAALPEGWQCTATRTASARFASAIAIWPGSDSLACLGSAAPPNKLGNPSDVSRK
jgi:hypothetical protein